jgi:hypothetical protein
VYPRFKTIVFAMGLIYLPDAKKKKKGSTLWIIPSKKSDLDLPFGNPFLPNLS